MSFSFFENIPGTARKWKIKLYFSTVFPTEFLKEIRNFLWEVRRNAYTWSKKSKDHPFTLFHKCKLSFAKRRNVLVSSSCLISHQIEKREIIAEWESQTISRKKTVRLSLSLRSPLFTALVSHSSVWMLASGQLREGAGASDLLYTRRLHFSPWPDSSRYFWLNLSL